MTESYKDAWTEMKLHKFFDNVTADHPEDIMASSPPQGKSSRPGFTGHISFTMRVNWSKSAMHVSKLETFPRETKHLKITSKSEKYSIVDVRTYLLGGAIDGSEANGIIRDPKLELESSRFTFDLVPLSYESVDVVVGENWLLRHKAEMVCLEKVVKMPWKFRECLRQETRNDCRNCKVTVGSNGNLLWKASILLGGVRVAREDDYGVTEGREDIREVFQQRRSGEKRKLSRCGRNQMGNEPILALPEGADDFVVYYDARSKDLEACLEKGRSEFDFEAKCHLGKTNVDIVPWSEAKNDFKIDVQRSDLGELNGAKIERRGVVRLERKTS
ncbi:hypothetical protein Tco_1163010 [Tanacetum coccineum]